jgi:hypothetical protein
VLKFCPRGFHLVLSRKCFESTGVYIFFEVFFSFSRIGAANQNVTDEMVKFKLALLLFFHVHEHSRLPGSWYSCSIGKELLYFLYVMQKNVVLICFVAAKKRLISYAAFFFLRKGILRCTKAADN